MKGSPRLDHPNWFIEVHQCVSLMSVVRMEKSNLGRHRGSEALAVVWLGVDGLGQEESSPSPLVPVWMSVLIQSYCMDLRLTGIAGVGGKVLAMGR